jgi:hypothetical protein
MSDIESEEPHRLPGWSKGSYAYHGDDGSFYKDGADSSFGAKFGVGDIVGCGVDEIKGELFFTLNGKFIGVAATGLNSFKMRPCVGLVNNLQSIYTNFGQLPFLWDFNFGNLFLLLFIILFLTTVGRSLFRGGRSCY